MCHKKSRYAAASHFGGPAPKYESVVPHTSGAATGRVAMLSESKSEAIMDVKDNVTQFATSAAPPAYTADASSDPTLATSTVRTQQLGSSPSRTTTVAGGHVPLALSSLHASPHAQIQSDVANVNAAIARVSLGEFGAKFAAKVARIQLIRDLWAVELERRGYASKCEMEWRERRVLKRELRGIKGEVKALVREARWNGCKC